MDDSRRSAVPQDSIPALLRGLARWIRWRLQQNEQGRLTKVPDCSTRDPSAWRTYEEACAAGPVDADGGIGFVLTGGVDIELCGRLFAIDIDGCRDPINGTIEFWADAILNAHGRSYTEVTPSGCGLRQWFIVRESPARLKRAKCKVPAPAAPNVPSHKAVEVQLFGYGAAQYVTCSGAHLPGTSANILTVVDLGWLVKTYGMQAADDAHPVSMPVGAGPVPSLAQVRAIVQQAPNGPAVISGDWKALLGDVKADRGRSASEAFWRAIRIVLAAAGGHGSVACQFLLHETAWGRGEIEDSREPLKYTRHQHVATEIARVAAKQEGPTAAVFDDGFDHEAWADAHPRSDKESLRDSLTDPPVMGSDGQLPVAAHLPKGPKPLLIHGDEFIEQDDDDEFLVYRLLPRRGLGQIFGDPGVGKTPYALSLAVHIAAGKPTWFGHEIDRHGTVVYMVGEDLSGIRNRYRAERQLHRITGKGVPIHFTLRPGRLSNVDDVAIWYAAIKAMSPNGIALLVIDTQARNFGDGSENDTEDMGRFVDHCQLLADRLGCLVLIVHHTGHVAKDRARGSGALFGALDVAFLIEREGTKLLSATPTKAKNWAAPEPLRGTLSIHNVRIDRKGRSVTAVALRDAPPSADEVFGELEADDPVRRFVDTVAELNGEAIGQRALADRLGCSRNRKLGETIKRAIDLGLVTESKAPNGAGKAVFALTAKAAGLAKKQEVGKKGVAHNACATPVSDDPEKLLE